MACGERVDIKNPCRLNDASPMLRRYPSRASNRLPILSLSTCFSWIELPARSTVLERATAGPSHKNRARRGVNKSVHREAAPDGDLLAHERGKGRGMPLCG